MRTWRLLPLVLTLALVPAPAGAESWHGRDAAGDVQTFTVSFAGSHCRVGAAKTVADDRGRDITRFTVDHTADTVEATLDVGEIERGDADSGYQISFGTSDRAFTVDVAQSSKGKVRGSLYQYDGDRDPGAGDDPCSGPTSQPRRCPGLEARLDRDAAQVLVAVPRTCLDEPSWVRAGARTFHVTFPDDPNATSFVFLYDEWHAGRRPVKKMLSLLPPIGPKVRVS